MATAVLSGTPSYLSPVNKEIWYIINSGSSSLTDFKYIVSVNSRNEPFSSTNFTKLQTYKLPPRPLSGEAQYSPNRLLRAVFKYNIAATHSGWTNIGDGLTQFRLNYGFEYNPNASYITTTNTGGFMTLGTLLNTPEFEIGDIITVNKENKQINIGYDGTCSVVSKPSGLALVTDKPFGITSSIAETGVITNLTRQSGTTSIAECYNGTRQYLEREEDFTKVYQIPTKPISYKGKTVANFLTNWDMPYKTVFSGEYETLSTILATASGYRFAIETYNSSGAEIGKTYSYISNSNTYKRNDFGIGPQNINLLTGTTSFLNGVDNYAGWVEWYNWLDITFHIIGAPKVQNFAGPTPSGQYNSKPYWYFTTSSGNFYFWFSSANQNWQASSALGGGNDWLQSISAGIDNLPPEGTYSVQYLDGQDGPYFDEFTVETGLRVSEIKKYKLKNNCQVYQPVRIVFLNRAGGWDYFTFTLDTKRSVNIDRTKYTKTLPFNYNVGLRGDTVLSQKIKPTYVITSNWIDDYESVWLEELFTSPEVFWLNGTDLLPIVITDTQYQVQTQLRNQTFNITVNFELSYNENIQNE